MQERLIVIALFTIISAGVYLLAMRAIPMRGWLRLAERLFIGLSVVYLVNLLLTPFGLNIVQSPFSTLTAGYLGLPGAVLAFVVQRFL